jgi:site-specific DNA-methyltransferase (adenine-specific)
MNNRFTIHTGDCREVLRDYPSDHFDSIVSDPPYGLSFMGKGWDRGVPGVEFWKETLRVAKPGAHLLAFGGTRTFHRLTVAIEDAGWEVRDCVMWLYGSGFPKSHNGPWGGTALKPAWEPVIVARKPLDGTVAANVLQYGTGALNIDECRVGAESTIRVSNAGTNGEGWGLGKHDHVNGSTAGRWPANVMHDGSDEVVAGFPVTGSDSGSAARFFYCAKASKADRDAGLKDTEGKKYAERENGFSSKISNTKNIRINIHPTVKPTALMRYLCRLVTPRNGVVLDPFCGSGSTGKAAILEGFHFVGIDLDSAHVAIAEARCQFAVDSVAEQAATVEARDSQLPLF